MQRTKPPFRADQVGSLLRSAALKDARAKRASGEISADQLKVIEDREIEDYRAMNLELLRRNIALTKVDGPLRSFMSLLLGLAIVGCASERPSVRPPQLTMDQIS